VYQNANPDRPGLFIKVIGKGKIENCGNPLLGGVEKPLHPGNIDGRKRI